jgi:hypothetical protein
MNQVKTANQMLESQFGIGGELDVWCGFAEGAAVATPRFVGCESTSSADFGMPS